MGLRPSGFDPTRRVQRSGLKDRVDSYQYVINLMLGVIHVGVAFQPRLNGYTTLEQLLFVAGKPLLREIDIKLMTLIPCLEPFSSGKSKGGTYR